MKAVKFLHPDKLPGIVYSDHHHCCYVSRLMLIWSHFFFVDDLSLEKKMIAQAAFVVLTESYNKYRSSLDNDNW